MPTPISYLSGNTLSYQSGMVKKGTIGLNLTSSLTGNYRWWNGVEVTSSQYLIYSDTYSTGASNESNVTPAAWSTPDLTDTSLLNLINTLPDRVGQTPFTTLSNALIWLNESGKYFVVRNGYDNIITSGLTLNLDAAWHNSYATGTTTWNDLSGSGNTFTLLNGVGFNTLDSGSLTFDGTDDYTKTTSSFMNGATQGTFEFWFQTSSISGGGSYFFHRNCLIGKASGPDNGLGFSTTSNRLRLRLGADSNLDSTIELNTNVIYHVVGTWDSGGSKIYINGVLNNSNNTSNLSWYSSGFETIIGRVYVGSAGASFTGKIYSARAYNRALLQSEILQNYHVTKQRFGFNNIVGNGLVLNLDSQNTISYPITGTSWYDLTGNNTGTLTNGPTFDSTTRGIVFDGVDDLMEGNDGGLFNFGTGDFSIDVWMKYNTLQIGYKAIFSRGNPSVGTRRWFYLAKYNTDNKFLFAVDDDILKKEVISNTVAQVNTWYHLTGVRRAGNASELYINGIFESSQSDAGNSLDANLSDCLFRFAAHRGAAQVAYEFCDCTISNGKIYNRALTETEILQNYYQGNIVTNGLVLNLDAGNLVSYGGTGTTWYDLTNTTTGATLTNGPTYNTSNGGSIVFDGTDDYVTGFNEISINNSQPFSVDIWFNLTSFLDAYPSLIQLKTNTAYGWNLTLSQSSPYLGITFGSTSSWSTVKTDNVPTVGVWNHIILTYNGLGATTISNYKTYLNTVEQTLSSAGGFTTNQQANYIGTTNGATRGIDDFYGKISNVKIYNRALTQSEVIQNFNAHKSRYGL